MSDIDTNENEMRFLIYRIGEESYGSPLLSIKEVLEYQRPKFMPNMVKYFSGVINVRGAIVGVVDLRVKLNLKESVEKKTAMLFCETDRGPVAAIVDCVESVLELKKEELEVSPPVKVKVDQSYLVGVAKHKNELITIIDLVKLLDEEELKAA